MKPQGKAGKHKGVLKRDSESALPWPPGYVHLGGEG
jgi:hypothetical protein